MSSRRRHMSTICISVWNMQQFLLIFLFFFYPLSFLHSSDDSEFQRKMKCAKKRRNHRVIIDIYYSRWHFWSGCSGSILRTSVLSADVLKKYETYRWGNGVLCNLKNEKRHLDAETLAQRRYMQKYDIRLNKKWIRETTWFFFTYFFCVWAGKETLRYILGWLCEA